MKFALAVRIPVLVFGTVLIISSFLAAYAQVAVNSPILTRIEKDIESGKLSQAEKPLLDYVLSHDRVWIARRLDIARHWREHFPQR